MWSVQTKSTGCKEFCLFIIKSTLTVSVLGQRNLIKTEMFQLEKSNNIEEEPSDKPEFLQVHAKLRARMDSK